MSAPPGGGSVEGSGPASRSDPDVRHEQALTTAMPCGVDPPPAGPTGARHVDSGGSECRH